MNLRTQEALEAGCESALQAFGPRAQMVKACEEMGELITQLSKKLNGSPTTDAAVVDEIADVLIMATQMRSFFGARETDERIVFKLDRTLKYIRNKDKCKSENKEEQLDLFFKSGLGAPLRRCECGACMRDKSGAV